MRAPIAGTPIASLMTRASAISVARRVTGDDPLYVVPAEKRDIPMVTANERLIGHPAGDATLAKRKPGWETSRRNIRANGAIRPAGKRPFNSHDSWSRVV
jgi:hypothetical protein